MIINGDWSWADYLETPGIDAAVAVLPVVNSTGQPMRTMFAPKGYSLNANTPPEVAAEAMAFVRHMTSDDVQRRMVHELRMLPARRSIQRDPLFETDPTLQASLAQLKNGRLMPVDTELRAVWDAMRPPYQALLGGAMTPAEAAAAMQREAVAKIAQIHSETTPDNSMAVINITGLVAAWRLLVWQRNNFVQFVRDWRRNRLAYLFVLPSIVCIFAVVVFPFFYNIVLSFSNMSLANFRDWQIVGLQNYVEVFDRPEDLVRVPEDDRVDCRERGLSRRARRAAGGRAQRAGSREIVVSDSADHSLGGAGVHHGAHVARNVRL